MDLTATIKRFWKTKYGHVPTIEQRRARKLSADRERSRLRRLLLVLKFHCTRCGVKLVEYNSRTHCRNCRDKMRYDYRSKLKAQIASGIRKPIRKTRVQMLLVPENYTFRVNDQRTHKHATQSGTSKARRSVATCLRTVQHGTRRAANRFTSVCEVAAPCNAWGCSPVGTQGQGPTL